MGLVPQDRADHKRCALKHTTLDAQSRTVGGIRGVAKIEQHVALQRDAEHRCRKQGADVREVVGNPVVNIEGCRQAGEVGRTALEAQSRVHAQDHARGVTRGARDRQDVHHGPPRATEGVQDLGLRRVVGVPEVLPGDTWKQMVRVE